MSRFDSAMRSANEALFHQTGDDLEYWPGGVEDDAVEIAGIFTAMRGADQEAGSATSEVRRGELQIYADATLGVLEVDIKNDAAIIGGTTWRVVEVLETVGGMHRLAVERAERAVMRRGRGRW